MNKKTIMPLQPIENGRFISNRIVEKLLETSTIDMNDIAVMDFTNQERTQFASLIGYSLSGFGDLRYVNNESYETAEKMNNGINEQQSRNEVVREKLESLKDGIRNYMAELFEIHPDDLT